MDQRKTIADQLNLYESARQSLSLPKGSVATRPKEPVQFPGDLGNGYNYERDSDLTLAQIQEKYNFRNEEVVLYFF